MRGHVQLRLEPFGAFDAIEPTKARQLLGGLCALVLVKMLLLVDVGMDLIKVASVAPSLGL